MNTIPIELVQHFVISELSDSEVFLLEETCHKFKNLIDEIWEKRVQKFAETSSWHMKQFLLKFPPTFFQEKLSSWKKTLFVLRSFENNFDNLTDLEQRYYYTRDLWAQDDQTSRNDNDIRYFEFCDAVKHVKKYLLELFLYKRIGSDGKQWINEAFWADIVCALAEITSTDFALKGFTGVIETMRLDLNQNYNLTRQLLRNIYI